MKEVRIADIITVILMTIRLVNGENITILTFPKKLNNKSSKKPKESMLQMHIIWFTLKKKSYFPLKFRDQN